MELGDADPVQTLNAPEISYQLRQCFWGGAQPDIAPRGAPSEALQMGGTAGHADTDTG